MLFRHSVPIVGPQACAVVRPVCENRWLKYPRLASDDELLLRILTGVSRRAFVHRGRMYRPGSRSRERLGSPPVVPSTSFSIAVRVRPLTDDLVPNVNGAEHGIY